MREVLALLFALAILVTGFPIGEKVCLEAGLNVRTSPCGSVLYTSKGNEQGVVTEQKTQECSFGTYTWVGMKLSSGQIIWGASETGLIYKCSGGSGSKNLQISYVHQVFDTGDVFDGRWACGPTCAVMAMSFFKKIQPHPITTSVPYKHTNDYGYYVSALYTSPTGVQFNRAQKDASGRLAHGAYGWCTEDGAAWAWRIQDYAKNHGLHADFVERATFSSVRSAIDAGHPVVLSTMLSSVGHLILVRGYHSNNSTLIVNDPWGDATKPNYGRLLNGANVNYGWEFTKTKWMVVVRP